MKKYLLSAVFTLMLLLVPAAAVSAFPVDYTAQNGVTTWGYMDEDGRQTVSFQFSSATPFNEYGFAVVGNQNGQVAVINASGEPVIPFQTGLPEMFTFAEDQIIFRYGTEKTLVYQPDGTLIGTFGHTAGFFRDGLIAVADANGKWGYAYQDGTMAIAPQFLSAGTFSGGRAIAQKASGYVVLTLTGDLPLTPVEPAEPDGETTGETDSGIPVPVYTEVQLPRGATPVYDEIYEEDLVVLSDGSRMALYSLENQSFVTDYIYQSISPFQEGYTMMRMNNRWGIVNDKGTVTVDFMYNYLSYMGEGIYAARGEDGYATAIDANGNLVYRTYLYAGGFEEIRYGLSWHGTDDNRIIFFSKVGGYVTSFENAEDPEILTGNVAVLRKNGVRQYVRLSDGKTLYTPQRTYSLGEITAYTVEYEKYLGTKSDGVEWTWDISYPQIRGLADETVQDKINSAIETFFIEGPSFSARSLPLRGTYGISLNGSVLAVWANCISGLGEGASVWNDNIALDLTTGERYRVVNDLFVRDYLDVLTPLLPENVPYYMLSYVRTGDTGISFYLCESATALSGPSVKEISINYEQIDSAIDKEGDYWKALHTALPAQGAAGNMQAVVYSDVSSDFWAYDSICRVTEAGLMQGDGGKFAPARQITTAEATATVVRLLDLETEEAAAGSAWYVPETDAARKAGLLEGFPASTQFNAPIARADVMQLLSNALLMQDGVKALSSTQTETVLALFTDSAALPADRRQAAALCVQQGLIVGDSGKLNPAQSMTRAEFSSVLAAMLDKVS